MTANTNISNYKIPKESSNLLTKDEEINLVLQMRKGGKAGAKAREQFIISNMRLVVVLAKQYENMGLDKDDLIAEGNLGLMKAVDKFDPFTFGNRFSTYASWWIKQFMKRGLNNSSRTIRLPVHIIERLVLMRRIKKELELQEGREVSINEISELTGINATQLNHAQRLSGPLVSLNKELDGIDDYCEFGDLVEDTTASLAVDNCILKDNKEKLVSVLNTLTDRERLVLTKRFGLDNQGKRTLCEIGDDLGITRERIRQIQGIALNKLKLRFNARYLV